MNTGSREPLAKDAPSVQAPWWAGAGDVGQTAARRLTDLESGSVIVATVVLVVVVGIFRHNFVSVSQLKQVAQQASFIARMAVGMSFLLAMREIVRLPSGAPGPYRFRTAVGRGVALVTGDRRLGLMLDKPVWENVGQVRSVALARDGRYIRAAALRARARRQMERLGIRGSADAPAGSLSGGNQQKVVFAKWLEIEPQLLLLDDPTRGVDVGAKAEMHRLIRSIAAQGAVVLLCSTEADELASLCDRILVFYRGRITAGLTAPGFDQHTVLEAINTGQVADA